MKSKLLALVLATSFVLTACGGEASTKAEEPKEESKIEEQEQASTPEEENSESAEDIELIEVTQDESSPMVKVTGKIKNTSGKDLSYLQIEIPIYDADGAKLGTALANINNLKADDVWKFEAISGVTEQGAKADLENIEYSGF